MKHKNIQPPRTCKLVNMSFLSGPSSARALQSAKLVQNCCAPWTSLGTWKVVKAVKTRYAKSATKTREAKILSNFNLLLLFLLFPILRRKSFFLTLYRPSKHFLYSFKQTQRQNFTFQFPCFIVSKEMGRISFPL